MQIVFSNSIVSADQVVINNAILAIFKTKNIDLASFSPSRNLFISNNEQDKADFNFNVNTFINDNRSYKMIILKNLANIIFSEYVDPRDIIGNYEILSNPINSANTPATSQQFFPAVSTHAQEIEKIEKELHTIEQEITSENIATIQPSAIVHSDTMPNDIIINGQSIG